MPDFDDTARTTDAGRKLLNRQPTATAEPRRQGNVADSNKPQGAGTKKQGQIDDQARKVDAGTKLLHRQPPQKAADAGKKTSTVAAPPAQTTHTTYPAATGTNLWTWRTGDWVSVKANGWDPGFRFDKLQELLDGLKERRLEGQLAKLAIVAHGDAPGVVELNPQLNLAGLAGVAGQLSQLGSFIQANGKLMFMSCIAGKGADGAALLKGISKILPATYVIGFETWGAISFRMSPGQMRAEDRGLAGAPPKSPEYLTEHSSFSKWALNGKIIRIPKGERGPGLKCANPTCPGHQSVEHTCDTFL